MCGIMGYIGNRSAKQVIFSGLKQMEYRGYDSCGIALDGKVATTKRAVGDTSKLDLTQLPDEPTIGIGHTRWATHGKPSVANAHPHTFGKVTIVHNGIIENFEALKSLIDASKLNSETDSEVLCALIDLYYLQQPDLLMATQMALAQVQGTFGLVVMTSNSPTELIVARRGSPILIGVDDEQYYVASDPGAIVDHTNKVVYLKDDQIARVSLDGLELYDIKLNLQSAELENLETLSEEQSHDGFSSFLEKEIFEQPDSLQNLFRGRLSADGNIVLGGPHLTDADIRDLKQIIIIGCGTAYYAGLYAKYALEELLEISVAVEHASEFRYRYGAYDANNCLAIFMSQSGETADTLASVIEAKRRRIKTMGLINVVGSTIAREVENGGIYLHSGREVSVASTKAYSSMVSALLMLGGFLASKQGLNSSTTRKLAKELLSLPDEISNILGSKSQIVKIAHKVKDFDDWFYLGRNTLYPVALEGALKVTEVAYVHAQAFPSGEMKHGPIALVTPRHLSILLLPEDELLYEKSISTLQELKARGDNVLTISTRPKEKQSDYHFQINHIGDYVDGLAYNVCLQLLALSVAEIKKVNIDKPRNLAKSVTVE